MKKLNIEDFRTSPLVTIADATDAGASLELLAEKAGIIEGQAEGAIANGTRVRKVVFEKGDTHAIGSKATVLSSLPALPFNGRMTYGYFVEWDDMPGAAVFIVDEKIAVDEP